MKLLLLLTINLPIVHYVLLAVITQEWDWVVRVLIVQKRWNKVKQHAMGVTQAHILMLTQTNVLIAQVGIFQLGKTRTFVSGALRVIIQRKREPGVKHVKEVNLETEKRPRQKHSDAVTALVAHIMTKKASNRIINA